MDMVELAKNLFGQPYHLLYAPMVELFIQLLRVELFHYSCLVVGLHIPKFAIPVPATQNITCNIHQGSDLAELLKVTKLIVWDETPMCHKFAFEALDKSLKDIMQNNLPFGRKIIIFGGDFR